MGKEGKGETLFERGGWGEIRELEIHGGKDCQTPRSGDGDSSFSHPENARGKEGR